MRHSACDSLVPIGMALLRSAAQRKESVANARFYEDSFVKLLLIAASMVGTSWAPHEGMWGTWHGAVVFMTGHADVASSVRAMKAGAVDFLEKPLARETLFDALQQALARDAAQRAHRAEAQRQDQRLKGLTARERAVFDRVVAGRLNKQIADELGISLRTVKAHRALVMEKLGVVNAAELGRFAAGRG